MYDLLVFIGRFQPFHNEHKRVIDVALSQAKNVLVLVGSSLRARTPKNPFTYDERVNMIFEAYPVDTPLWADALRDYPYDDDKWAAQVRENIKDVALHIINEGGFRNHGTADMKIGIIGAKKDDTSFYLDMFPEFPLVEVELTNAIHATDIRYNFLTHGMGGDELVPASTYYTMRDMYISNVYSNLRDWQKEIDKDKALWADTPYPVKQVTADALVEYNGRILLVQRGKNPGKGLWALPGGHVNVGERVLSASFRELREETGLNLSDKEFRANLKATHVFDDPARSTIGHVITHAAYIDLSNTFFNLGVKGMDDAADAMWWSKDQLSEDMFFDDHWHMIQHFIGDYK